MDYKQKYLKYKQKYLHLKKFIGMGKKDLTCVKCGSDWIFISSKGQILCEDCYKEQHKKVLEYHKIQENAYTDIKNNDIDNGIKKLEEVIKLRNKLIEEYFDKSDRGHDRFANEFLPNLIIKLKNKKMNESGKYIWDEQFKILERDI
jgi:hypothetical protein